MFEKFIKQEVNVDYIAGTDYVLIDYTLFGELDSLKDMAWDLHGGCTLTPPVFPQY